MLVDPLPLIWGIELRIGACDGYLLYVGKWLNTANLLANLEGYSPV